MDARRDATSTATRPDDLQLRLERTAASLSALARAEESVRDAMRVLGQQIEDATSTGRPTADLALERQGLDRELDAIAQMRRAVLATGARGAVRGAVRL